MTTETKKHVKPGWKSTEFWVTVALIGGNFLSAVGGALPDKWAAGFATAAGVAYKISRGLAKING